MRTRQIGRSVSLAGASMVVMQVDERWVNLERLKMGCGVAQLELELRYATTQDTRAWLDGRAGSDRWI